VIRVLINAVALRGGGSESFLRGLLPELLRADPGIAADLLVAHDRRHIYEAIDGRLSPIPVPTATLDSAGKRLWFEHAGLLRVLNSGRYDICLRADEMVSPASLLSGVPVVSVFHATQHLLIPEALGEGRLKTAYLRWARWAALRSSRVVVAVSHHERGELAALFPFSGKKLRVIYHGIDRNLFRPAEGDGPRPSRAIGVDRYFFCASDRHVFKNYPRLIEAFALLCRSTELDEHLVIAGRQRSAAEEERIALAVERSGVRARIHVMDYVPHDQLPAWYQGATAYVFPSTFETFGFTPLEAMACGVPVACSHWSAIPEVCGSAAEYFDPFAIEDIRRAMEIVATNARRRADLRQLGLRRSAEFSWTRAAREYAALLRGICRPS